MDFIFNTQKKHAWWVLKETFKNSLKEVSQRTSFSAREEVKAKSQWKYTNTLKD